MGETKPDIPIDEMERERIARFADLTPSPVAYVDTLVPEHERTTYNVIGRGVSENTGMTIPIPHADGFNITYVSCEPGKGAALHSHPTVEVFFVMEGQFAVFWGDEAEREVTLDKWDMISIPPGVMRGFRNSGDGRATLMAIFGGTDAGHVDWAPQVIAAARATGMELDDNGKILSIPQDKLAALQAKQIS